MSDKYKTFSAERWGLSACIGRDGYIVPEIRPNQCDKDHWHNGTVAPYAAGSAIMFTPAESIAALRAFRDLKDEAGQPLLWRDPASGGYGLVDAFNLDQKYVCDDDVGIDQGPLLLAIENARGGLIWRLFMASDVAQRAMQRLHFEPAAPTTRPSSSAPARRRRQPRAANAHRRLVHPPVGICR